MDSLGGLDLKTTVQAGFPVWASKLGAHPVRVDCGGRGHMTPLRSFYQGEAKSEEACPFDASTKSWTVLPLRACIVVIRVGVFMSFAEDLI